MERETIVSEIRRIADREGRAPGSGRFQRETGIGEKEWKGKYWARWSDAITEAGLSPNTLQVAYDDLKVLRHLVELIEALERWPSKSDIRIYAREHPGFPAATTIRRRGSPPELARMLLASPQELSLSEMVVSICQSKASEARQQAAPAPPESIGHVYLLRSGKYFKIGHSNDPARRAYEVRLQMPEKVKVVHQIETDDPAGIEAYWHRRFADRRRNGEWFLLSASDVASFKARQSM